MTIKQFIEKPQAKWQSTYLLKNPWAKYYLYSKSRAKKLGLEHRMITSHFKMLWFRDDAENLESPSIDRIDPTKGYTVDNCRFIERSENSARAQRGRDSTDKQRQAGRNNIIGWAQSQTGKKRAPYKKRV